MEANLLGNSGCPILWRAHHQNRLEVVGVHSHDQGYYNAGISLCHETYLNDLKAFVRGLNRAEAESAPAGRESGVAGGKPRKSFEDPTSWMPQRVSTTEWPNDVEVED